MKPHRGIDESTAARLRIAILAPSTHFPAWQARCLRNLLNLENVAVTLIMPTNSRRPRWRESWKNGLLWSLIFGRILRPKALKPVDMTRDLSSVIAISSSAHNVAQLLDSAEQERLRECRFDVVLSFAEPLAKSFAALARYGVWLFHDTTALVCFWERYRGVLVQALLQRFASDSSTCPILVQGTFPTTPHSHAATVDAVLFEMARWPEQMCRRLLQGRTLPEQKIPSSLAAEPRKSPNALQTLLFLVMLACSGLAFLYRSFFRHGRWAIGVMDQPIETVLDGKPLSAVRWLDALSENRFAADPFALARDGDLTLLYEEFPYATWKGRICAACLRNGNKLSPAEVVFDFPFHASYPYLLEQEGGIYCVPETWHAHEVVLFKAVDFPHRWVRHATLLEGIDACDCTLVQYQGRWWLFCTYHNEGSNLKLFLWHAADLLGPWQPHAENPVKIDVTSARPAGTPFVHQGVLYRPAQDCSRSYGGRIVLNRVTNLTTEQFTEEPILVLEPPTGRYTAGLHTISAAGAFTVIDGLRYEFNLTAFKTILARRFRRLLGRSRSAPIPRQEPLNSPAKERLVSSAP